MSDLAPKMGSLRRSRNMLSAGLRRAPQNSFGPWEREDVQASRAFNIAAFMFLGELIKFGKTDQVFARPKDKRTQDYITAVSDRPMEAVFKRSQNEVFIKMTTDCLQLDGRAGSCR